MRMSIWQCRLLHAYFEKGTLTINLLFRRTGTLSVPRCFLSIESVYSNYHVQSHYRRTLPVSTATLLQSSPSNPKFTLSAPLRSQFFSVSSIAVFPSKGVFSADTSCPIPIPEPTQMLFPSRPRRHFFQIRTDTSCRDSQVISNSYPSCYSSLYINIRIPVRYRHSESTAEFIAKPVFDSWRSQIHKAPISLLNHSLSSISKQSCMLCALIRSFSADTSCPFPSSNGHFLSITSHAVFFLLRRPTTLPVVVSCPNNRIDTSRRFLSFPVQTIRSFSYTNYQFGGFSASEHAAGLPNLKVAHKGFFLRHFRFQNFHNSCTSSFSKEGMLELSNDQDHDGLSW
jgi:hypothetical protein